MSAPQPPRTYDVRWASEMKRTLDQVERESHKKLQDLEMGPARLILTSPNGTRYSITVSNAGALTATPV